MRFFEFSEFSETNAPSTRSASRPMTTARSSPTSRRTPSPRAGTTARGGTTRRGGTATRPTGGGGGAPARGRNTPTRPHGGARPRSPTTPSTNRPENRRGFDFDRIQGAIQQGWDLLGPHVSRLISPQPGPAPAAAPSAEPGAAPYSAPPSGDAGAAQPYGGMPPHYWQPRPSFDRLAMLMQALQQRQIPPLTAAGMGATPLGAPQADGLGLLRLIVSNPHFQQALQQAAMTGAGPAAPVSLPMPAAQPVGDLRSMHIPLGAVINAIASLTGPALMQLNARTSEADPEVPEYLVSEDGEFVVDPASSDDRAALVVHMFEVSDEAQRLAAFREQQHQSSYDRAVTELDETDEWARDIGLL